MVLLNVAVVDVTPAEDAAELLLLLLPLLLLLLVLLLGAVVRAAAGPAECGQPGVSTLGIGT